MKQNILENILIRKNTNFFLNELTVEGLLKFEFLKRIINKLMTNKYTNK